MASLSNNINPNSPEFGERRADLLALWDKIAASGSSIEGLLVMGSPDALSVSVRRAAQSFQYWMGQNIALFDAPDEFREAAITKLAEIAPRERTHWSELVAFAFACGVQIGGWNVVIDDDPTITDAVMARKAAFQSNYFQAKAAAGFKTYEEVAAAAGLSNGTVLAIEKYAVVPRRATAERLAKLFGLGSHEDFFKGEEGFRKNP